MSQNFFGSTQPASWLGANSDTFFVETTNQVWGKSNDVWALILDPNNVGTVAWGSVTGTLSSQTDLQTALNLKANLTSAVLVTPNLGTPSAGVLTSCTGTAAGLTAGNVTTNANLTGGVTSVGNAATVITNANLTGDVTSVGNVTTIAPLTINAQSGTTYTFVLTDAGKVVTGSNAGATTYTVPTNASVAFSVGQQIVISQVGAGKITLAAAGGVTINSVSSNLSLSAQYAGATLLKTATNTWLLIGSLAA